MIKQISLASFVKQECCNFVSDECLGVDVFGKRFREQGICWIFKKKLCVFFARCVLPVAKDKGYGNVISQYQKIDINSELKELKVRSCSCGVGLPKGKKLCEKCRKRKRRETKREYQRNYRGLRSTVL